MSKIATSVAEVSVQVADHTGTNRNRTWAFGLKFVNNVLGGTQIADSTGNRSNGANGTPAALQRELQAFGSRL